MKKLALLLMLICLPVLALTGCGPSNSLSLLPPPPLTAASLPAPNAPSASVALFADDRLDPGAIGVRRDGSAFTTAGNVPLWISRALADELARNGLRVTFAMDVDQARSGNPDYLVTGKISEVWLKENSATEMSVQMRASCTLANRKGKLWTESCNSSQTKSSLPTGSAADNLLLDTMRDLIKPLAQKIIQTIETSK